MEEQRIARSRTNRLLGGVAAGLANAFDVDPIIFRVLFVLLSFVNGIGVIAYLVLWVLLPFEETLETNYRGKVQENVGDVRVTFIRIFSYIRDMFQRAMQPANGNGNSNGTTVEHEPTETPSNPPNEGKNG